MEWSAHHVDAAIAVAYEVRRAVLTAAPSLAPLMRIDLIQTNAWGFLVSGVEALGAAPLQLSRSTSSSLLPRLASSMETWSKASSHVSGSHTATRSGTETDNLQLLVHTTPCTSEDHSTI